jgi:4-deoxy-L-threo-5-hexosulose-uronate ketol-isomerase
MQQLPAIARAGYRRLGPKALRDTFVVGELFRPGRVELRHWETDRTVIGGIVPAGKSLPLPVPAEFRAAFFCERREAGVINLGGPGVVRVDGRAYALDRLDCLYVGRGAKKIAFSSRRRAAPARFYLLSYPAHARYPTRLVRHARVPGISLGTHTAANGRTLFRYIHAGGAKSCQLVLGLTILEPGSKWNTMPPHTHLRRSEVYLYFGLPPRGSVRHFLGAPEAVRHTRCRDLEAVLSPPWSIHCGVGTTHYGFVWGMGGENQDFADMDPVDPRLIR